MDLARIVGLPFRYKPWRPRHVRLIASDMFGRAEQAERSHRDHLTAVIDWLCRAQDVRNGQPDAGGVSAGWSFEDGWLPSYPETSGYIVETFLAAATALGRPDLVPRANRILDWELSIQHPDGAFPGHFGEPGSRPVIFNQGQIMHGMLAGFLQQNRGECLESAVRGGRWLARQQDADGCWRKFEHNGVPHTYNTRGTWALLATGLIAGEPDLVSSATKHLEWAIRQQTASGWFENNAFTSDRLPFTHTIAYAIRGFLECGVLLGEERYLAAAARAASAVAHTQRADGWIAGAFDREWRAGASYSCLTGNAQMALDWIRLAQEGLGSGLREPARRAIEYVKRRQRLEESDVTLHGAVAGSAPIWGRYSMFEFPNWAAKFFADALMMEMADAAIPPVARRPEVRHEVAAHG
ncbi:MAG: prenyltransferase/squalene oxidase repeat-containing protein [Casimicrobiaceae bacterium]